MKKKYFFKIIFAWFFLSILSACTVDTKKTLSNKNTTQIPITLQKLSTENGELSAYILIDDDTTRIPMIINAAEETATVVIPGLSREIHRFVITYEYTGDIGTIILARTANIVDLSSGSVNLNINAESYDLDTFDEDSDGVNNANELLIGSNPIVADNPGLALESLSFNVALFDLPSNLNGVMRVFLELDNDRNNREEMNVDVITNNSAFLTLTELEKIDHDILITVEYVDERGIIILATLSEKINLFLGPVVRRVEVNEFNVSAYDEDGDGANNVTELLVGTDPYNGSIPVFGAMVSLSIGASKTFRFNWSDVVDATYYRLLESFDGVSKFVQLGNNISQGLQTVEYIVPLFKRSKASYKLQSCNEQGCVDGPQAVNVIGSLIESIGYIKANEIIGDLNFGVSVSLSRDGTVLAVGGHAENRSVDTDAFGVNAGVVYVFTLKSNQWEQTARLQATNGEDNDYFGNEVVLSADGTTLAISAGGEDSDTSGINTVSNNLADDSGAVYIFSLSDTGWIQQAYIKASNSDAGDAFGNIVNLAGNLARGISISLSANGDTLAVGAYSEDSDAVEINNDQINNLALNSGAVYVFTRNGADWSQQAYLKSSNSEAGDSFGRAVSISADGLFLAVGASGEDSKGTGVNGGFQLDNTISNAGAVYIFIYDVQNLWQQDAYIKPNITTTDDLFGRSLSLSGDGSTLAIFGNDNSNLSGAVYIFNRKFVWEQQALIKSSNIEASEAFGNPLSLSDDGNTLVVGDRQENSNGIGLNGDQSVRGNNLGGTGAAYSYIRRNNSWNQLSHIKAINPDLLDGFGTGISLSGNGESLVIGAPFESSDGIGIQPASLNNNGNNSGAIYLY